MSTRTKYILEGVFFLLLGGLCMYSYVTGKVPSLQRFSLPGTIVGLFVGALLIKNGLKK